MRNVARAIHHNWTLKRSQNLGGVFLTCSLCEVLCSEEHSLINFLFILINHVLFLCSQGDIKLQ